MPGCFPSEQERPDCQAGLSKEDGRTYTQVVSDWRDQYNAQLKSGKHAAIVLFAAEYPNDMVSDLPTVRPVCTELKSACKPREEFHHSSYRHAGVAPCSGTPSYLP